MKLSSLFLLLLPLTFSACQSAPSAAVDATGDEVDAGKRAELMAVIANLEGRWQGPMLDGSRKYTEFYLSSMGSAVREIMLPGEPSEMTNMYTLEGDALVMTHYCASGNQPRMRATSIEDGRMAFVTDGVSDLKSSDDIYMGAMTLVVVDEDHIEQHWSALKDGELDHEMVIEMTRVE